MARGQIPPQARVYRAERRAIDYALKVHAGAEEADAMCSINELPHSLWFDII